MTAVLERKDSALEPVLYMVLELSNKKWKVGFSDGERSRLNTIDAGDWVSLNELIGRAKEKFKFAADCRVVSCYKFLFIRASSVIPAASILHYFTKIEDPRIDRQKKHQLQDIFFITLCAVICGADNWVAIEEFGKAKQEWFTNLPGLQYWIPSFRRSAVR